MHKSELLNFILAIAVVLLSARLFVLEGRRAASSPEGPQPTPAAERPAPRAEPGRGFHGDFHGGAPAERRGVSDMALRALGLGQGSSPTNAPAR